MDCHADAVPGTERYQWDHELSSDGVRLGIRDADNGRAEYVITIDGAEGGSILLRLGEAAGDGFSPALRQRAYARLADIDSNAGRRGYWAARARCPRAIPTDAFYDQLSEQNIVFGPAFRAVREIWRGEQEAIGRVQMSDPMTAEVASYIQHPAFLDGCLQLFAATLFGEASRKTFLPVGMESFRFEPGPVSMAWSHVRLRKPVMPEDKAALADLVFYDRNFQPIGEIAGFSLRLSDGAQLLEHGATAAGLDCYRIAWESLERGSGPTPIDGQPTVLGDGPYAAMIRNRLGEMSVTVDAPATATDGAVIVLDDVSAVLDPTALLEDVRWLLDAVKRLDLDNPDSRLTRLWFVTRSTQQVTGHDEIRPGQAFVWGFARSLEREYPWLTICCIDEGEDHLGAAAAAEIAAGSAETMVAYRGDARYVARVLPLATTRVEAIPTSEPFTLRTTAFGSLDNLYLAPSEPAAPAANEVEIRVHATGLNFKDVLYALGMLAVEGQQSGVDQADNMLFGGDCAGIITRVGAEVTSVRPGDRVVAIMAFGCFASHVTVGEHFVAPLPNGMSFQQGAAVPTAYLTVYHAFFGSGGLKPGDHVLIHAAAGGVGLAAVQLALHFGATVYATASRSKHAFLRALGVAHVYDSRSLEFAERLVTDLPQKLDLIVNSLNGDFIDRSFSILRPGGRFVELGKIGVWSPTEAARRRPDARYLLFDLMDVASERPDLLADEFRAVLQLMTDAGLRPTRVQTFPMTRVNEAFRCMAEARHIGKIVVTQPDVEGETAATIRPNRCHVVVGGLGALGQALVDWLATRGARHITVIGRRTADTLIHQKSDALRARGVALNYIRADVADRRQTDEAFERIAAAGVPIGDIYHLAGELVDALLRNQTLSTFAAAFRAKVDVAINLHLASLRLPHTRFICFSSIASVFGSPGQTNYAAANAVLDALAHHRRALGLHALTVNWGPWADAGMADAMAAADKARLADAGVTPLTPAAGFTLLEQLLVDDRTRAVAADVDWRRALATYPAGRIPPCMAALGDSSATEADGPVEPLSTLPANERLPAMIAATTRCIGQVLRLSVTDLAPHNTLGELGLDSLMGMELRYKLERLIGTTVPVSTLLRGPSVAELAAELLQLAGLTASDSALFDAQAVSTARWLMRVGGPQNATVRLVCFHHLGGSAEFFRRWTEPLTDIAEVLAVQLPGRGDRADEPAIVDMDVVFEALLPLLQSLLDRPMVLYGHSMGSHLAFECARRLRALGYRPDHLFASGLWSPLDHHIEKQSPEFVDIDLANLEIPSALRDDNAYMHALNKLVHADTELLRNYRGANAEPPLDIPITAFSGENDPFAPPPKVARWAGCTSSAFVHLSVPGKHMFVADQPTIVDDRLRSALASFTGSEAEVCS
ncbi:MAG: SDR family NAD(P)-dependent oxidoreductase [Aquisalimonadaceae bacterium]